MIVEIEKDYDNSTNNRVRYMVRSEGYVVKRNLSLTKAKKVKRAVESSINARQRLRKLGIQKNTAARIY